MMDDYEQLEYLKTVWNVTQEEDVFTTATSSLAYVRYKSRPAIVKIFHETSDEFLSGKALQYFGTGRAVEVLAMESNALLLERCVPGRLLKEMVLDGDDDDATIIFCDIVKSLHDQAPVQDIFPSIADWGKGFGDYLDTNNNQISRELVRDAKNMFDELVTSQGKKILLHGDLHHENILLDETRGYLAIDPKGIIGEREIEISAFLRNPLGSSEIYTNEDVINRRVQRIMDRLDLDKTRLLKWCYALTVLSSIWRMEIDENPDDWIVLSGVLKRLIEFK